MMGRAGRPQFDDSGIAVIMVHDVKKHFYKKFLYEPFPVESNLLAVLSDHLNAEIVASTINTKQEAMEYLTWTYFFRRLLVNPSYYELDSIEQNSINLYLSNLIRRCLGELEASCCITIDENGDLNSTTAGRIASFYYLTHLTMNMFHTYLNDNVNIESLIDILSLAHEFAEFPVRHNEDKLNTELSKELPLKVNPYTMDSPHTKVNLLLQAHFSHASLPCSDYLTDTKSVLDQCLRIMQAILDYCADKGWLSASLSIINLMQMTCQARWINRSDLLTLPHVEEIHLSRFHNYKPKIDCLPRLMDLVDQSERSLEQLLGDLFDRTQLNDLKQCVQMLPRIELKFMLTGDLPKTDTNRKHLQTETKKTVKNAEKSRDQEPNDGLSRLKIDMQNDNQTYDLYANEEYVIDLDLLRLNQGKRDGKAYAPKYPKPKDENWIVILGVNCKSETNNELICLKRLSPFKSRKMNSTLYFKTPEIESQTSKQTFMLSLFLMSDVYLGLDQQYDLNFNLFSKKR